MYKQELSKQTSTEEMVRADSSHPFFLGSGAQVFRCLRYGLTVRLAGQRAQSQTQRGGQWDLSVQGFSLLRTGGPGEPRATVVICHVQNLKPPQGSGS